jgi:beta-glucosidase
VQDDAVAPRPRRIRKQIAEASKWPSKADVIVLAIGGNEQTSREAWSLKHMGDRAQAWIDRAAG